MQVAAPYRRALTVACLPNRQARQAGGGRVTRFPPTGDNAISIDSGGDDRAICFAKRIEISANMPAFCPCRSNLVVIFFARACLTCKPG
jgi:hypothetical protein